MRKKYAAGIYVGLLLLLIYLPILILAAYSFTTSTTIGAIRGFSLENYGTLFSNDGLRNMIFGTLVLAFGCALIATVLGTLGAIGGFYSKPLAGGYISALNEVPVVNADVVTGFSVCIALVVVCGIDKSTFIPLVVGHVVLSVPFVYLSVLPKLKQMDPSLYEAAIDLGATPKQALTKVVLPQIYPGIVSGFALALTLSLDDYFIASYTKPATFDTISTYVVNATKGSQTQIKTALWALSTVIFVVVILVVIGMNLAAKKRAAVFVLALCAGVLAGVAAPAVTARAAQPQTVADDAKHSGAAAPAVTAQPQTAADDAKSGGVVAPAATAQPQTAADGAKRSDAAAADDAKDGGDVTVLRVCSWEEYIDLGGWEDDERISLDNGADIFGVNPMYEDFEDWYFETTGKRVKVEYSCFGTNEDLYNQLTLGDTYDLVCPSDYMLMKLIAEDMAIPFSGEFFDPENEYNYYTRGVSPYIARVFQENEIGGTAWEKYAAGYMWGTTGVLYNPKRMSEEEASTWAVFANPKFHRQVTLKDNVRDTYFAALGLLREEKLTAGEFVDAPDYETRLAEVMNDVTPETIGEVERLLQHMMGNIYALETDSGKSDMVTGKIAANYQWSGDAVFAMDQAEEDGVYLSYAVPRECSNLWFDGWIMLKKGIGSDKKKQAAAEAFVNFVSRPDNVVRNMYYIGYTSAISGGEDDTVFSYIDWCYGAEDGEEAAAYPLGYFFSGNESGDERYTVYTSKEQVSRQLYAQYPTKEVIERTAIMGYFDEEETKNINQMWINIRCFHVSDVPAGVWVFVAFAAAAAAAAYVRHRRGQMWR